jgi:hypothetical protein
MSWEFPSQSHSFGELQQTIHQAGVSGICCDLSPALRVASHTWTAWTALAWAAGSPIRGEWCIALSRRPTISRNARIASDSFWESQPAARNASRVMAIARGLVVPIWTW